MYITIFLKDKFTVRHEGGLSNIEFKKGCRIDGDPSPSLFHLIDRYTLRGFQYYNKECWDELIYGERNALSELNGEFREERYIKTGDGHKNYPDEKRPYPQVH